jgi:UDP-N-acetylglucosamine--N-acetylmuramyl-(pentapeptide) pyrophosphoryl-undecaprenol N-acetylglucosamine transferase
MMSVLLGKPLVLHEQNSVAAWQPKVLRVPTRVQRIPERPQEGCLGRQSASSGLPAAARGPVERLGSRAGKLRLLVVAAVWAPKR